MKKVGIMGGTFNPIHYGHLFLAENAYEQIGLAQVLFIPSKNPPHKAKPNCVTEQQRVEMITLAISDNPHFELSTLELEREGMTYTADTLRILTKKYTDTKYYFIVGADSLFMMQNWHEPQAVFNHSIVVVANRDNADKNQLQQHASYLKDMFSASILLIDMPSIQIASGVIRERVAANKSIRYYVPDAVNEYIKSNRLYAANPEDNK